ncbi:MAG: 50S ribosomal protein L21 [Alphaproteobacteria bacterium]|nr:50S ribosomal protein L21 [Alphaproteobacteria bacterium]|tara:strand:- start:344 stop:889 length:546 start_codon:yes stop_codon:yes gene_type:complete
MYAVIKTGGKQYRVAKDEVIAVEKLAGEAGASLDLGEVLMIGDDKGTTIGSPLIEGASVSAEVVEQARDDKIIVFKKKRRKNYRRKKGHRQDITLLRITDINAPGAKRAAKSGASKTPKKKDEAPAEAAEAAAEETAAETPEAKAKPKRTTTAKSKTAAESKSTATRSQKKKTDSDDKDSS